MTMLTLLKLNKQDPRLLIPYVNAVVEGLRMALDPSVCRRVQILLKDLWMKLNTMIPRRYAKIFELFGRRPTNLFVAFWTWCVS